MLAGLSGRERGGVAFRYGARWATRHQSPETGVEFFEEALENDPDNEGAFTYLRDLWGAKQGDWERVSKLAEKTADRQRRLSVHGGPGGPGALASGRQPDARAHLVREVGRHRARSS